MNIIIPVMIATFVAFIAVQRDRRHRAGRKTERAYILAVVRDEFDTALEDRIRAALALREPVPNREERERLLARVRG